MTLLWSQASPNYLSPRCDFIISCRQRKASSWTAPEQTAIQKQSLSLGPALPWERTAFCPHQAGLGLRILPHTLPCQGKWSPSTGAPHSTMFFVCMLPSRSSTYSQAARTKCPTRAQGILSLNPVASRSGPQRSHRRVTTIIKWDEIRDMEVSRPAVTRCNSLRLIFLAKQVTLLWLRSCLCRSMFQIIYSQQVFFIWQSKQQLQFWKGERRLQEQKTAQLTSLTKQFLQPYNHHQLFLQNQANGTNEIWVVLVRREKEEWLLHVLLSPISASYSHTSSMVCSHPNPSRVRCSDTNLSLAHTPNTLLAPGSEEGFIPRGALHSSFFSFLSSQHSWPAATLREARRWPLQERQGRSGSFGKVFTPMEDEISHVPSTTPVPW